LIIFIDEIDAIGGRRGPGGFDSNDDREQTLNQLLSEMAGFEPGARVVVMAATNRAEILDSALLRPGRFDRTVEIPLPSYVERTAILAIHGRGKTLAPDVDFDVVSRGTPGFSRADLADLVNEAAINVPWPSTKPGTRLWPRSWSTPIPSRRSRFFPGAPLSA
jgi:cell division protease FtsH